MEKVDLKIGFHCNNHCRHCVQGDKREKFGNKSLEKITQEIKMASKVSKELVITGGEPTLHKDFLEIVRLARQSGFELVNLQTNGRMLYYKEFCTEIIKAGVNSFTVALAGHCDKLHDFITTSRGSFVQTVEAVRNLKSLGQYVAINSVVSKLNYRYLPQMARFFVMLGVDQYQFAFVHPLGNAWCNFYSVVPRMSLIEPYVKAGLGIGIKAGKHVMAEAIPYCFMEGYEGCVAERFIPDTIVYDADNIIEDYTILRKTEGKKKRPSCAKCKFFKICEGPWKEYPQVYGWGEFKPVGTG